MKRIFVSHPLYSEGDVAENMKKVDFICRDILEGGHLPISPLHLFGFMDEETPELREEILGVCQSMIEVCDELWSYGDKGGCKIEKRWAYEFGVKVFDMRE